MIEKTLTARGRAWLAALAVMVNLASCGSGADLLAGVGSGGTGGGSIADAFSLGAIRGFGSVIVNGVRYDDTTAVISNDDGQTLSRDALRLSMVVEVRGAEDSAGTTGVAESIRVVSEIRGPVQSVSPTAGRFVAMGVTVNVTEATVFEGVGSLAGLRVGDAVEVYGFFDRAARALSATRVELRTAAIGRFKSHGLVGAVDPRTRRLQLGDLVVDFGAAALAGIGGSGPEPGQEVRLSGASAPGSDGLWRVDRLEAVLPPETGSRGRVRIEGPVNDYRSAAGFVLGGVPTDASGAQFPDGASPATLRDGARVVMEGRLEGGVFKVTRVEYDRSETEAPQFEVKGLVDRVTGAGLFVVRNTVVDASAAQVVGGTLADLRVGRAVEVKGRIVGGVLRASVLEFDD